KGARKGTRAQGTKGRTRHGQGYGYCLSVASQPVIGDTYMNRSLQAFRLAALAALVSGSVAVAQTGTGSTGSGSTGAGSTPAATGGAMGGGQGAAAARKSQLSRADEGFISQAAQNGHAEVEASKMALEKASDPKVKEFAKHMVEDHTKANEELRSLASSKGVELPDGPSLLQKGKSKLMLSTADGEDFDRRYM